MASLRSSTVAALIVVASAATASAECAWMLWSGALDTENQAKWSPSRPPRVKSWSPNAAYATKVLCQQEGKRQSEFDTKWSRELVEYHCLPDTVDPRELKSK
jgi:hypothetical protein